MRKKKKISTIKVATVALGLGAVIGAVAGLLNAPKRGSELKEDLEREAELIFKKLKISKKQIKKVVKENLGEVSPQTMQYYVKAKSEILARVAKYKDKLTQSQYNIIVDGVMKKISKSKGMQKPLTRLGKEFKKSFKDIKRIVKNM
jgi:gas vesicle protein